MSHKPTPSLEQLLRRPDIWRGNSSRFVSQATEDTGFPELNKALQHKGWPTGNLIEVSQRIHASEWWLFHNAIKNRLSDRKGQYIALINPPILPLASGLDQLGLPIHKFLIITTKNAQEFITSFTEINHSEVFPVVLSWQENYSLSYNQLRKIQLSTAEKNGIYVLFCRTRCRSNHSPAKLRLGITLCDELIKVCIYKQRGQKSNQEVYLPIPHYWKKLPSHRALIQPEKHVDQQILPKIQIARSSKNKNHLKK